jgi:membrane protease YdiL (CAAX protease family)
VVFRPEHHPFEQLAKERLADYEWIILFVEAVVLAPIAEEWLFRGLLQGWLRRTNLLGHAMFLWIAIGVLSLHLFLPTQNGKAGEPADANKVAAEIPKEAVEDASNADSFAPFCFAMLVGAVYAAGVIGLYRPLMTRGLSIFMHAGPSGFSRNSPDLWTTNLFEAEGNESRSMPWSEFGPTWRAWKDHSARLAIIGSSLAFAIGHRAWPSAVPLFLLGLALGWLAYRTQNLVPSIVVHSLFNLVAFIVLWLSVHPGIIGNDDNVAMTSPEGVGIVNVVPGIWWPR